MQSKKLCYNLRHNLDEAYMRGSKKNFATQQQQQHQPKMQTQLSCRFYFFSLQEKACMIFSIKIFYNYVFILVQISLYEAKNLI